MRNGPLEIGLLLAILLAGCRGGDQVNNQAASSTGARPGGGGGAAQTASLTGLYEGGNGPRRNQLCMIERERGVQFGFVAWGSGDNSCSGGGPVVRQGDRLSLRLDGDESCTVEAQIEGGRVTFPDDIPADCARYYCGPGAQMTGITFDKVGGSEVDALRAADLVGDRLCG